jgi:hypothetical protein
MEINKNLLSILLGILFLLTVVSAVPTLVAPTNGGTLTGASAVLNVTNGTLIEMLNCTWYASSASTANSTAVSLGSAVNATASAKFINRTFASTILQDSNDYVVYSTCFNATTNQTTASATGVIVSNTNPTAPVLTPADQTIVRTAGTQTFTGVVVDATTTGCTYTIYRGGSSSDGNAGTAVYSGTSCTASKTFSTTADNGLWYVTMTASDGVGTASTTNKINVILPGLGGGHMASSTENSDAGDSEVSWIVWVLIIVAIIVAIGFFINKKDKK